MSDLDELDKIAHHVKKASLCGLGQTAPNPVLSTLAHFREEYEDHVEKHQCPAFVCNQLLRYEIDVERCKGCGACARACPAKAISGEKKEPHTISQELCIKCGVCVDTCPKKWAAVFRRSGELVRREQPS